MLVLYSKSGCNNCNILKQLFDKIGIDYKIETLASIGQLVRIIESAGLDSEDIDSFPILLNKETNTIQTFTRGYLVVIKCAMPILKYLQKIILTLCAVCT